jgi:DNA-binding PadR family transcriptional regulator
MPVRSSTNLVLGMLRLGVGSGYAIKKFSDISTRYFWATSYAQVYPELARLEEEGLVDRRDDPQGARRRSVYEVTPAGERALLGWLRSRRMAPPQIRIEGVLRLFLADALPPKEQLEVVRRLVRQCRTVERRIREEIIPVGDQVAEGGPRFPVITARFGADLFGFAGEWLEGLERELTGAGR